MCEAADYKITLDNRMIDLLNTNISHIDGKRRIIVRDVNS